LLVTIPPLQISKSVATHVSHANRLSHLLQRRSVNAELPNFDRIDISALIERRY
jgi:hypothetical protein